MRRVTTAVIGNGKTTRANVEALLGDIWESVDMAVLAVLSKDSEAVKWAISFADFQDNVRVDRHENLQGIYDSTEDKSEIKFFLLWDDEDSECQDAAAFAQEHDIPLFDLTDGLVRIDTSPGLKPATPQAPVPEAEQQPKKTRKKVDPTPEEVLEIEESEDEDEYQTAGDMIIEAFEEAGRAMALAFVDEVKRLLKEPNDAE